MRPTQVRKPLMRGASLLLVLLCFTPAAPGKDKISTKEDELNRVRGRINELQTQLKIRQDHQAGLNEDLQTVELNIGRLARRLRVLAATLDRQRAQLKRLKERRASQEKGLALHHSALAKQIRAAYAMGRQERVKILLNQQDPAKVSRVMVYYDYFNRARTEQLALIEKLIADLQETEQEVNEETSRLEELQARELQQQAELEQARLARQKVIKSLATEIRDKDQELGKLKKDERELQSLLERLQQDIASLPANPTAHGRFQALKGRLPWPAKGRLSARFGAAKGAGLRWEGVIISAPEGREVKAVHHGRVAFADWLRGFGLLLIIDHGDGYMTLYGHNQSLFKETGEWVKPGETVGLVGSSGGRLKAGVYFSIRKQGNPVNPKSWCKKISGNKIG